MGKSTKKRPQAKQFGRHLKPLETTFDCPFCDSLESCSVDMVRKERRAFIKCRVCFEKFSTPINNLQEPIDVYSLWIDACEEVNH